MKKIFGVLIIACMLCAVFMLYRSIDNKSFSTHYTSNNKPEFFNLNLAEEPLVSREDIEIECRQYAYEDGVVDVDLKEYLEDCIQDILEQENQKTLPSEGSAEIYRT